MTWRTAKLEALRLVEEIAARHSEPAEIQLTVYSSEANYRQHKPLEPWPWGFHTQVVRSTYRELLKRGYSAKIVTLRYRPESKVKEPRKRSKKPKPETTENK